ncbi:SDR family oxidoreductase [Gordonia sp. TBRC 11910]|uniref:SDR family oxidoreductase n=1 Tax=Gordonia asplenii TaxID=2725283 RepID=A0A848KWS4_9ACTN|nr:SDR family oxidoreductase [Gordonia asplenii]NMO03096.1 SDR family oxidoreductase [Gordonia asplenii]
MPRNILVLGASGQIARHAIEMLATTDAHLTLFARNADRIAPPSGARVVEGDVLDTALLADAVRGQDVVYANLAGQIADQAAAIVHAMTTAGVQRLVFIVALGIYEELPQPFERWNEQMIGRDTLSEYGRAADIVEASSLDYTLIRPAWLTDTHEVDYETTQRNEQFKGTEVSRKSVAALVVDILNHPEAHVRENLGIDKPGTDGPKPSFY